MDLIIKEPKEDIFSRLSWKTNFQKNPYLPILINKNEFSKKPFIGNLNRVKGTFLLKRNRPVFLREFLPTVIIKGKFVNNKIVINTRLGIITTIVILFYLFVFYASFFSSIITSEELPKDLSSAIFNLLFITIIPVGLVLVERMVIIQKFKEVIEA
jgi:hypothetical protein